MRMAYDSGVKLGRMHLVLQMLKHYLRGIRDQQGRRSDKSAGGGAGRFQRALLPIIGMGFLVGP